MRLQGPPDVQLTMTAQLYDERCLMLLFVSSCNFIRFFEIQTKNHTPIHRNTITLTLRFKREPAFNINCQVCSPPLSHRANQQRMLRRGEAALLIACFARLFICTKTHPPNPQTAPATPKRRSVHFRKHRKLPSRVGKSLSLPPRSPSLSLLPLPKFGILPPLLLLQLARLFAERERETESQRDVTDKTNLLHPHHTQHNRNNARRLM